MDKDKNLAEKTGKRSLLEKYDIPVENLSYEYITQCESPKELERIVVILRSGEEGCYPDLTKHAEIRLAEVKPESGVLRTAEPVLTKNMLEPEKRIKLENDITEWMSEMKLREKDLEEGRALQLEPIPQPAVRQITFDESKKKQSSQKREKNNRIGACDYAGWDKYDADTELNRIDLQHEKKKAEVKMAQKKFQDKEEKMKKASREDIVKKLTLTGTELSVMAENEREKGNEAFKAGDYEEALQFYNSSIAMDATIMAYNNRAITYIKLQRYKNAVDDCNAVITMDHTNIKALLRRGLALDNLEKRAQALADYEAVLKLEPSNKVAIAGLNKLRQPCDSKKIRMKIEEGTTEGTAPSTISSSSVAKKDDYSRAESKTCSEKSKNCIPRIRAQESTSISSKNSSNAKKSSKSVNSFMHRSPVQPTSQLRSQVCFCDNAPTSSQYSSPKPHIRDIYCPEASQSFAKIPKHQSIFTDTTISSGVIIEEIPNDSCEKFERNFDLKKNDKIESKKNRDATLKNFGTGDNGGIKRKSDVIIEELSLEKYNSRVDAKNDKKNADNFSKNTKKSNNFSKPQAFSSAQVLSQKSSGIIIEEISNEPSTKSEVRPNPDKIKEKPKKLQENKTVMENFASGDNGEISKKYGVVMEEIPMEKYNSKKELMNDKKIDENCSKEAKKTTKITKLQNFDDEILFEKSSRVIGKKMANESIEGLEKKSNSEKSEEKTTKPQELTILNFGTDEKEKTEEKSDVEKKLLKDEYEVERVQDTKFDTIESPYEFLRIWHSLRKDHDLNLHAKLLNALPPENIDTVIGNKLDGEMLSTILRCFEQHFCNPGNTERLSHFLQYLGRVKRFSLVKMFMDAKDKEVLRNILSFLEGQGLPNFVPDLRKMYDIPL